MIFEALYFSFALAHLVYANPMLVKRSSGSSCNTKDFGDLKSMGGTCETFANCKKYISLPEQPSSGAKCESQTETCCVKKLCNLSYSTRSWVVNKKFYCTNAANHKEVLEDRDNQNLVDQDPRSGWNPPKIPFAIPVNSGYAPCPGPDTYTFSFGGDGINGHGLICLIDSQPSLSYQNQGQDSVVAAGTSSGIETSGEEFAEVPNSGNILYDEQSEKVIDSYSDS